MKYLSRMANARASRIGLLLALLLSWLPAIQAQPAAAQPVNPERVTYEVFMPWVTDAQTGREVRTTDSLVLGEPRQAETATDKPPQEPSDTTQIEPPPPGAPRQSGPPESPKTGSGDAPVMAAGWHTILYEDFEGDFPSGAWRVVDDSGVSGREVTWDDDDHRARSGQWSAWAANGGDDGLDPAVYRYPNNMRAWMIYGPFSLAEADAATLTFDYWNRSERNYDWFGWYASADGVNFHGWRVSGDSEGWRDVTLDLTAVPRLGDLRDDSSVWIAFVFRSDGDGTEAGPFVDNVALHQAISTGSCPEQMLAEYFPNRDLSGLPVMTRCESLSINHNWGTGSPAPSLPVDNFSVRWTGNVALSAGRYTFQATVDDGVRLWLDGTLVLDSWREQGQVTVQAPVEVTAGVHQLRIEYFEQSGGAAIRVHWTADSACPPTITGWRGEYWRNEELRGAPALCRNDADIDFNWGSGSPSAEIPVDHFSARWTRTVNFNAGTYRFRLRGDDGVRLWIDDNLVIDEWRVQSPTEFSAVRTLSGGSHKLKVEYFDATGGAEVALDWEVAPDNAVIISNRPAFDTCIVLPTTGQMATWWDRSPYSEINVYLGGSNLGCPAYSQALNAEWVEAVGSQGWNFIPTWVGPQAPCSIYWSRFPYDVNAAYQAGRTEADAAARAARDLGLTTSGLGGSVIYYDLEAYDIEGATNVPACRAAANAFVNGWVERLNELGNRAGVYGAAFASHVSDWAGLDHVPDDVWIAQWIANAYNPNITVWDVSLVDDSLWARHQRIFQYTPSHEEQYGGVTLIIDSNIVDGHVVGQNPRAAGVVAAQRAVFPAPLLALERLPSGAGWLLTPQRLHWSADGGATWLDITPADAAGRALRAAAFLDDQRGWLVWAGAPDDQNRSALFVSSTDDGGATWRTSPLTAFDPGDPNSTQSPVQITFVDGQTGWIAIQLASRVSFSRAVLLGTRDGGQTWTPLDMPSAGTLRFVDANRGWLAGGVAGETLYTTRDGGQSWQTVELPVSTEVAIHHAPAFADAQTGVVPVTQVEGEIGSVAFYATTDGGAAWTLAGTVPLSGTHAVVDAVMPDRWTVADTASGKLHHVHLAANGAEVTTSDLLPGVTHLAFAGAEQGWAAARTATCFGDKTGADAENPFRCVWQQSVVGTRDSGQTWDEVTPSS